MKNNVEDMKIGTKVSRNIKFSISSVQVGSMVSPTIIISFFDLFDSVYEIINFNKIVNKTKIWK